MKTNYEISLNNNDLFKAESLSQIITNLEILDSITEDVFSRINKNIIEKKNKLDNLKYRINRCTNIIGLLETLPQALTIKSKRQYPLVHKDELESLIKSNNDDTGILEDARDANLNSQFNSNVTLPIFTKSIYYDDICDFNLVKNKFNKHVDINTKPFNPPDKLGKKPDGSLEDVTLTQEILNSQCEFKDIKTDLNITKSSTLFNSHEIPPDLDNINSLHQFMDKAKVLGEKTNNLVEVRDSNFLNVFMNKNKPKEKVKTSKKIQEAPTTISEKHKMTRFKQKKELIRRNTAANVELNIPMNLNLPLISDFDVLTNPLDDYYAEEKMDPNEVYAPQGTIFGDDVNEFHTPLDVLINYKNKQPSNSQNNKTSSNVVTKNNNDTVNQNNINNQKSDPQPINDLVQRPNNPTIENKEPTITKNEPVVNSNNENKIPQGTSNVVPIAVNANIRKPPPLPPKVKGKKKPIEKKEIKPVVNEEKNEISLEEKAEISKAPIVPKMSLQDELAMSLGKLKKGGVREEEPKKEVKPAQPSMLDLLRKEINLRYDNLNRDSEPTQTKNKKKKKRRESDSFSSDNASD